MKKIFFRTLPTLLTIALALQGFAQQKPQVGSTSGTRASSGPGGSSRRPGRGSVSSAVALVEKDFDEALSVIQSRYVDGKGLDYNSLFKSSIIGMLRSLDPHSNYYDREEFEELKTDQRSE
ncbi:MAG TPA: hypothetical protein VJ180_07625, partial [Pyrinomonadaceae bacterium]|nr:hypothetical protein [Pyrinomonadaceae bacterium]